MSIFERSGSRVAIKKMRQHHGWAFSSEAVPGSGQEDASVQKWGALF